MVLSRGWYYKQKTFARVWRHCGWSHLGCVLESRGWMSLASWAVQDSSHLGGGPGPRHPSVPSSIGTPGLKDLHPVCGWRWIFTFNSFPLDSGNSVMVSMVGELPELHMLTCTAMSCSPTLFFCPSCPWPTWWGLTKPSSHQTGGKWNHCINVALMTPPSFYLKKVGLKRVLKTLQRKTYFRQFLMEISN